MIQRRHGIKPKNTIKRQLYILYFLVIFIPIVFIGGYLTVNTRSILMEQNYAKIKSDNLRIRGLMLDLTSSVDAVGSFFFSDNELSDILNSGTLDTSQLYDIYRYYGRFNTHLENHTEISRINLYINTPIQYGCFKKATDEIKSESWYQEAIVVPQPIWISETYINNMGVENQELWYVRRIPIISTGEYAILVITVNNNHLKSRIGNNGLFTDITVNDGLVFYSELGNEKAPINVSIDYEQPYYSFSGEPEENEKQVLIEISTLVPMSTADNVYIVTYDYKTIPQVDSVFNTFLLIIAISIFVPFLVFFVFTHSFSNRLLTLRHAMHKAGNGDYKITDQVKGNDELADVFSDMQKMIESIIDMEEEIFKSRLNAEKLNSHQQRIQYTMLASQINPHFLYNTLETIRMKALSSNDKEVADAIKLLGKSMRHVLEHSMHTVALSSELEYIRIYLQIQHIRFGDRIRFTIDIKEDVDAQNYYILPLLLQPIVENAVLHGLESQTQVGDLRILTCNHEDKLFISVEDNGVGMSEKELEELALLMKKDHINPEVSSIGLNNIYHRIQLFYGEDYGITIDSKQGYGTKVTLFLPRENNMRVDISLMT